MSYVAVVELTEWWENKIKHVAAYKKRSGTREMNSTGNPVNNTYYNACACGASVRRTGTWCVTTAAESAPSDKQILHCRVMA